MFGIQMCAVNSSVYKRDHIDIKNNSVARDSKLEKFSVLVEQLDKTDTLDRESEIILWK